MEKNPDGSWTFFNRDYKPLGVISNKWEEWDDHRHKIKLRGLGGATLTKLSCNNTIAGNRIYFYNDATNPEISTSNMKAYLEKLTILMRLQGKQ